MRQILQSFAHAIVGNIVGGRFSAKITVVADILFEEPVLIVAADDRIGKIEIFDDGLQLSGVMLLNLATKDDADLIGCPMVRFASINR